MGITKSISCTFPKNPFSLSVSFLLLLKIKETCFPFAFPFLWFSISSKFPPISHIPFLVMYKGRTSWLDFSWSSFKMVIPDIIETSCSVEREPKVTAILLVVF